MTTKYYILFFSCLFLGFFTACSSEDELIAIPDTITDHFAPNPDATDAESVLRKTFYEEENSYLLFNDTLRHEPIGSDFNGDTYYFTETLDMGYAIGESSASVLPAYLYEYLESMEEKDAAVSFLKEYILPQLSSQLRPFSWFLVRSITNKMDYTTYEVLNGQRSIAIAVGYTITEMSIDEKEILSNKVLAATLAASIAAKEKELTPFYSFCEDLYGGSFAINNPSDWELNMQLLNEAGFIIVGDFWGYESTGIYPQKKKDVNSFIDLVTNYTKQEIEEKYAGFPIVIEKAEIMRGLIESLGFTFK